MGAPGGENFFHSNLQEICVSAPPGHEVHHTASFFKEIFRTVFLLDGLDLEVYLDGLV